VCLPVARIRRQVIVIDLALLDRVFAPSLSCFCPRRSSSRKDM
jgi:hypothetical protein